jgi:hypothetical protein
MTKLSNLQIELLKIYEDGVEEQDLLAIKKVLAQFFAEKATQRMDELWSERGWTADTMQEWLDTHQRSPSK